MEIAVAVIIVAAIVQRLLIESAVAAKDIFCKYLGEKNGFFYYIR